MKTQIHNLINGCERILRNLEDPKYLDAKAATSHVGFAGTNRKERNRIAELVREENMNGMDVEIRGIDIHLDYEESLSGKTCWWTAWLDADQYRALGGSNIGASACEKFKLNINMDCTVETSRFARGNERQQWRQTNIMYLDESFVTIK